MEGYSHYPRLFRLNSEVGGETNKISVGWSELKNVIKTWKFLVWPDLKVEGANIYQRVPPGGFNEKIFNLLLREFQRLKNFHVTHTAL